MNEELLSDTDENRQEPSEADILECKESFEKISKNVNSILVGQEDVVAQVLCCMVANGHVLLEGVPGLGKTLLVRALATSIQCSTARIQFTPDLMPSDVTGHAQYNMKEERFVIRKGPVFTNLLLADEINRAPAKTQSALLEVMQERQATIEGESFLVDRPYMVLATQNPIEFEGTYPLPEAQLDRFMLNVFIDFPEFEDEVSLVDQVTTGRPTDSLDTSAIQAVASEESVTKAQRLASEVLVDQAVLHYIVNIVRTTREFEGITNGASPRAAIAIVRVARALALLSGRGFVTPDDVREVAIPALRHRIALSPEYQIEGMSKDQILSSAIQSVDAPRT